MKVFASNVNDNEVWRAHELKVINMIRANLKITYPEAKEILNKTTIDKPIRIGQEDYWIETD